MTTVEAAPVSAESADPYLWLEEIAGDRALAWVRERTAATIAQLSGPRQEQMAAEALEIADAQDRVPGIQRRGEYLYNYWRDAEHPRGLWRRTTLDEYRKDVPDWDVVLDLDAVEAAEGRNWVWGGADVIAPEYTRALIELSPGGADASAIREFDMQTREFVPDGFNLPPARSDVSWEDENTVLVATDFGEGSISEAGFPLLVKRWRRGTDLSAAEVVFAAEPGDLGAFVAVDRTPGYQRTTFYRQLDNRRRAVLTWHNGELVRLEVPDDAPCAIHREWILIMTVSPWQRGDQAYAPGTVLAGNLADFLSGTADLSVVVAPDGRTFVQMGAWTKDYLLVLSLQDVASRLDVITPGTWTATQVPGVPANADIGIGAMDRLSNEIFLVADDFGTPPRMLHGEAGGSVIEIKRTPDRFDADGLVVSQHFATSADGTRVPYFLVTQGDCTEPRPTLLHGYGGFAIPQRPGYLGVTGRLWLQRGGAFAMANTRGGSEYGAEWYLQSIREGRHRVAEDFAAVAEDLVDRGVTTAAQLGVSGASAGGLLMGVMLTRYPELFGALVCQQPLLDMRRFAALGGSAFIAEYGDPDNPDDWEFIKDYSPYHNIAAGRTYPPILITTSSTDDRVQPGHARKMAAALQEAGHEVLFYENTDGGHGGATTNADAVFQLSLIYEFLFSRLGG